MKKFILAFCTWCVCLAVAVSANVTGSVRGKVIDAASSAAFEFVNVSLYDAAGAKLIKGTITDESGKFRIDGIAAGTYKLRVSYVGYKTSETNITIQKDKPTSTVSIKLREDSEMLGEVQVVGQKSQMRFDIDKRVFNADQAIASLGGSASDILSNVPSIDVDSEGTISLRGNSSVTIWINGKASGLTTDNQAEILEQIPAETIDKVEVITNPSSKYSPEGTAGIINIVLKDDLRPGYYGGAQLQADIQGGAKASVNVNFTSGKWNGYANIGARHRRNTNGGYTNRRNDDGSLLDQTTDGVRKGNNGFMRLGVGYKFSKQDEISLNGFGIMGQGKDDKTIDYTSTVPGMYHTAQRLSYGDTKMRGGDINLDYTHRFGEESSLRLMSAFNTWNMFRDNDYAQTSIYADHTTQSLQRQSSDIRNHGWEFQADYTNAINENNKIEAGYKGTLRYEDSPLTTQSGIDEGSLVPQADLYNRFIYDQNIQAAYLSYTGKVGKFGMQVGLRGEYSHTKTESWGGYDPGADQYTNIKPYSKGRFDLFPSVFLSYSLPKGNELQLNYTRRIERPWGGMLNSFTNITDSTSISYGNPDLDPQYSNAYELNYIKNWERHMLSVSGYFRNTKDVFQRINYLDPNKVMNSTWFNVTKSMAAGSEIVVKNKLFEMLDLTTTVNLYFYKLDAFKHTVENANYTVSGASEKNFSYNFKVIANFMLPKSFSLQLTGGYNSRETIAQGTREPSYMVDAGLKKSFLQGRLNVVLNARDIFDSRHRHSKTSGEGFWQESESWRHGRNVRLTVSYNFGNMKSRADRNRDTHDEDMYGEE